MRRRELQLIRCDCLSVRHGIVRIKRHLHPSVSDDNRKNEQSCYLGLHVLVIGWQVRIQFGR